MDPLIFASLCEKSNLRIPRHGSMDPLIFARLSEKARQFKQYEDELFDGPSIDISRRYYHQLTKFERHVLIHVSVLVDQILEHGSKDEPFKVFLVDDISIFDDGLEILNGLRAQCYWYHRAVRRIQRWWRHQYYGPDGKGFSQAYDHFQSLNPKSDQI